MNVCVCVCVCVFVCVYVCVTVPASFCQFRYKNIWEETV
jgi:hypothetical protein